MSEQGGRDRRPGPLGHRPRPIVAAPMAGGVSTPELVAAVADAGGLGFLAAGYLSVDRLAEQIADVRRRTSAPFGVNVFVPGPRASSTWPIDAYADRIRPEATALGAELGRARWEDDEWQAKLALLTADPVPVTSFTFGRPDMDTVAALRSAGTTVVGTATGVDEARDCAAAGVDALCVQGVEAGGHQGSFDPDLTRDRPLRELLFEVRRAVRLPLVAAGGLMTAADVAAVLDAGAIAAQCGTAFLRSIEAGTKQAHRDALADPRFTDTVITRAFSGRPARALRNAFVDAHDADAPTAYPEIHHLTAPLRAAAGKAGDAERLHLWAGVGHRHARAVPAADITRDLTSDGR